MADFALLSDDASYLLLADGTGKLILNTTTITSGLSGGLPRLSLHVFEDSTEAAQIADWTTRARNIKVETGPHGYATLSADIAMSTVEAFRFYDNTAIAHVVLSDGAFRVFEGRIEDRPISPDTFGFTAFGYYRGLFDVPYNALWSTQDIRAWRTMTSEDQSGQTPEKYVMRLGDGDMLYTSLRQGETYTELTDVGAWLYEMPHNSDRDLAFLKFDYDMTIPSGFNFRTVSRTADLATSTVQDAISGTGFNATGSKTITLAANRQAIELQLYNNTAGTPDDYTNSGETDDWFVKITNIRIMTSSGSSNVYADEIASGIVTWLNGINSTQINSSTGLIDSPTIDLTEEEYLEQYPGDIISRLASLGDNSSPPEYYEAGIWEDRKLFFRQRGNNAQEWYIDLGELRVDSTLETLYNSAYATYRTGSGKIQRSTVTDDTASKSRYGLTRQKWVSFPGTDSTQAGTHRDVFVEENKDITPRAEIRVEKVFTSAGALAPIYLVRALDNVTIRNLPPQFGDLDKIRKFRIHRTRLDCMTGELTIIPETEPPSLVDLVAANTKAAGD